MAPPHSLPDEAEDPSRAEKCEDEAEPAIGAPEPLPGGWLPRQLDLALFLVSEAHHALGAYVNLYLITERHWSQASVGLCTSVAGWLGLLARLPAGALIDAAKAKQGLVVLCCLATGTSGLVIYAIPSFWSVMVAFSMIELAWTVQVPALVAITLGIYPREHLSARLGRNSACIHSGNLAIALLAGVVGWRFSQSSVFLLVPLFSVLGSIAVMCIPSSAIDHERARGISIGSAGAEIGKNGKEAAEPASMRELVSSHPTLLIYGSCYMLFNFANKPLMPLVGQKLALSHPDFATVSMSACILVAQSVMVPTSVLIGHLAKRHGRRGLLAVGFGALPIRSLLYTFSDAAWWLVAVQTLDGVGIGVTDTLTPLIVAEVAAGSGRINIAQALVGFMRQIGTSTSPLIIGILVDKSDYSMAFLTSAVVSLIALSALLTIMPETMPRAEEALQKLSAGKHKPRAYANLTEESAAGESHHLFPNRPSTIGRGAAM